MGWVLLNCKGNAHILRRCPIQNATQCQYHGNPIATTSIINCLRGNRVQLPHRCLSSLYNETVHCNKQWSHSHQQNRECTLPAVQAIDIYGIQLLSLLFYFLIIFTKYLNQFLSIKISVSPAKRIPVIVISPKNLGRRTKKTTTNTFFDSYENKMYSYTSTGISICNFHIRGAAS